MFIGDGSMKIKKKVLIADDSKINQELITELLGDKYQYCYADNGVQLIDQLNNDLDADIILLDINMPLMDGLQVLELMNDKHWIEEIPVVVISAENNSEFLERAYTLGATDYIPRPFSAVTVRFRVENTLMLYTQRKQLVKLVEKQVYEREETNNAMINIFSHTIELRNNESGKHTINIRSISDILLHKLVELTDKYTLTEKDISIISSLSSLHDIGKNAISEEILNKPGSLTAKEWEIMKTHTIKGDEIIRTTQMSQNSFVIKTAREICRWHHERWDGKGYPDGLVGDEIPISAQVVSIADVYDALTSDRCYKKAFSHDKAIDMILNGECGKFNPILLECLKSVCDNLKSIILSEKFDYEDEARKLTHEMLKNQELPLDDRSDHLFLNEKERKKFYKKMLGGIQFEYDCLSKKVTFTNWYNNGPEIKEFFLSEDNGIDILSAEYLAKLIDGIKKTNRKNPYVDMDVLISVNNKSIRHKVVVKTIWSENEKGYIGVVGMFKAI